MNELALAFTLGLGSAASPCLLPLYPGFIAYMAGNSRSIAGTRASGLLGLLVLLGVLSAMVVVAVVLGLLSRSIGSILAYLIPVVDGILILLGLLLVAGRNPFARPPRSRCPAPGHSWPRCCSSPWTRSRPPRASSPSSSSGSASGCRWSSSRCWRPPAARSWCAGSWRAIGPSRPAQASSLSGRGSSTSPRTGTTCGSPSGSEGGRDEGAVRGVERGDDGTATAASFGDARGHALLRRAGPRAAGAWQRPARSPLPPAGRRAGRVRRIRRGRRPRPFRRQPRPPGCPGRRIHPQPVPVRLAEPGHRGCLADRRRGHAPWSAGDSRRRHPPARDRGHARR